MERRGKGGGKEKNLAKRSSEASGSRCRAVTSSVCPSKIRTQDPSRISQILTISSTDPLATRLPRHSQQYIAIAKWKEQLNRNLLCKQESLPFEWPLSSCTTLPVSISQNFSVPSNEQESRRQWIELNCSPERPHYFEELGEKEGGKADVWGWTPNLMSGSECLDAL